MQAPCVERCGVLCFAQVSSHFFHRGKDDVERRRCGEAVEPRVRLNGETDVRYLPAPHKSPAICCYLVLLAGQELEPFTSVFESYYRYHPLPRPLVEGGLPLLLGGAVRYGNVPSEAAVQLVHYLPENLAVRRCVFDPVEADIVMNHLVDDCVFYLSFRQVEAGAEAQPEVVMLDLAEQVPACLEGAEADVRRRFAQRHGDCRQGVVKHQ